MQHIPSFESFSATRKLGRAVTESVAAVRSKTYPADYFRDQDAADIAAEESLMGVDNIDLTPKGLIAKLEEWQEAEHAVDRYVYQDAERRITKAGLKVPASIVCESAGRTKVDPDTVRPGAVFTARRGHTIEIVEVDPRGYLHTPNAAPGMRTSVRTTVNGKGDRMGGSFRDPLDSVVDFLEEEGAVLKKPGDPHFVFESTGAGPVDVLVCDSLLIGGVSRLANSGRCDRVNEGELLSAWTKKSGNFLRDVVNSQVLVVGNHPRAGLVGTLSAFTSQESTVVNVKFKDGHKAISTSNLELYDGEPIGEAVVAKPSAEVHTMLDHGDRYDHAANCYMTKDGAQYRVHSGGFVVFKSPKFEEAFAWANRNWPLNESRSVVAGVASAIDGYQRSALGDRFAKLVDVVAAHLDMHDGTKRKLLEEHLANSLPREDDDRLSWREVGELADEIVYGKWMGEAFDSALMIDVPLARPARPSCAPAFKGVDIPIDEAAGYTFAEADWHKTDARTLGVDRKKLEGIMSRMQWEAITAGLNLPMAPGLAIKEIIKQLKLPRPDAYSISHEPFGSKAEPDAAYSIVGVQANYKNGTYRHYVVDAGHALWPLCSVRVDAQAGLNEAEGTTPLPSANHDHGLFGELLAKHSRASDPHTAAEAEWAQVSNAVSALAPAAQPLDIRELLDSQWGRHLGDHLRHGFTPRLAAQALGGAAYGLKRFVYGTTGRHREGPLRESADSGPDPIASSRRAHVDSQIAERGDETIDHAAAAVSHDIAASEHSAAGDEGTALYHKAIASKHRKRSA